MSVEEYWKWIHNNAQECVFDGPEFGFDRAISKDMDNTVGDLRKRSKTSNCKRS